MINIIGRVLSVGCWILLAIMIVYGVRQGLEYVDDRLDRIDAQQAAIIERLDHIDSHYQGGNQP